MGTKFFPNWSKGFAVTAPWGIVLNEDILGWIHDKFFKFSSYNDGDWTAIVLWYCCRFEMWLDCSAKNIISEFTNDINCQVSTWSL